MPSDAYGIAAAVRDWAKAPTPRPGAGCAGVSPPGLGEGHAAQAVEQLHLPSFWPRFSKSEKQKRPTDEADSANRGGDTIQDHQRGTVAAFDHVLVAQRAFATTGERTGFHEITEAVQNKLAKEFTEAG